MKNNSLKCKIGFFLILVFSLHSTKINAIGLPYSFTSNLGSYSAIAAGTVLSSGSLMDDATFSYSLPFTFNFNATAYTQIYLSENGYLSFGTTNPGTTTRNSISSTNNGFEVISPFSGDLQGINTLSELRIQVLGTSPNRTFVAQWTNLQFYLASGQSFNFQLQIDEANAVVANQIIRFVYGTLSNTGTGTAQVGLRGTNNSIFLNRTNVSSNWSSSVFGTLNADACSITSATAPVSGLTFIWARIFPTINTSTSAISLSACSGYSSSPTTFTISASNLLDNLIINAPSNFAISTNSLSGFSSSLGLIPSSGSIANTSIYIIVTNTASGNPSGLISFSATLVSITKSVSAIVLPNPTVTVNNFSICPGDVYNISASGAVTYTYSSGSFSVNPVTTTTYNVIGTGTNGCVSAPATLTVYINPVPTVAVNSGTMCIGEVFTIVPTGASNYTFSNNNSTLTPSSGSLLISPSGNVLYGISGTNSLGCISNTAICLISVLSAPSISVNSGSICVGQSFNIAPFGGVSFTVSGGNFNVSPPSSTNYAVVGTGSNGCVSTSTIFCNLQVYPNPTISVSNGSICLGESYTMNPSGAASYTFSNLFSSITPTATGNYSIVGTSSAGCLSTNTAVCTVSVFQNPTISVSNGTICSGQVYTINPSGAATYTYGSFSSTIAPNNFTTVSIVGTNSNGCVSQAPSYCSIFVLPSPLINFSAARATICLGESNTLTASGAATYSWSNNSNSSSIVISPTINSIYTIVAMNNNTCTTSYSFAQIVDACTNINLNFKIQNSKFIVYPIPSNGKIFIDAQNNFDVNLFDLVGNLIVSQKIVYGINEINLEHFSKGIYFLNISDRNNLERIKVVKE